MINFIRNIPWKEILIIGLLAALGIGAVVGIGAALTAKTETVSAFAFAKGELDSNGHYVESDRSICTKELIECQGLKIEPDFDATGTYQVFYYGSDKQFIGATEKLVTAETPVYDKGNTFVGAKYCRIVITPDVPKDDDGFVEEDYKIKFYEVNGIANKFDITVNKDQKFGWKDVYVADESKLGKYYTGSLDKFSELGSYLPSKVFDLNGRQEIFVVIKNLDHSDALAQLCLADSNGTFIQTINLDTDVLDVSSGVASYLLVIPEGVSSAVLNGVVGNSYCIYVK